jgi:hypothetical protein
MEIIHKLIEKEHEILNSMLEDCKKAAEKRNSNINELFEKFKWFFEKHFFVEEKGIFDLFEQIKGEEVEETFELMKEHGELMDKVRQVEKKIMDFPLEKIEELQRDIKGHEEYEEGFFYEELDEKLGERQKAEIIAKIKEAIKNRNK